MRRAIVAGVAACGLVLGTGPAAEAHVKVKSTTPKRGSSVSKRVSAVSVTFTGQIRSGTLRVTSSSGRTVSIGSGGRDPRKVSRLLTELRGGLSSGRYTARWSIKAADGHTQSGSFTFRVR